RRLGVLHQTIGAAAIAIEDEINVAAIIPWQAHLPNEPVSGLFALNGGIIPWPVTRSMDFVKVVGSQQQIVARNFKGIMAGIGDRRTESLMVGAARVFARNIINGPDVVINKSAFHTLIA